MVNVLVIKANNRPDGVSTKMYETFVEELRTQNIEFTTFDVFEENLAYFGQELFNAFGKAQAGEELNEKEAASLASFNKSREALTAADVVVFAFPLWNLTIPAALQSFIDYTYGAGYTFKYDENGNLVSLMTDKKYIILSARGGIYSTEETAPSEMAVNYINNVVGGIFGLQKVDEVVIEGHNANPAKAEEIIAEGLERVKASAKNLSTVLV